MRGWGWGDRQVGALDGEAPPEHQVGLGRWRGRRHRGRARAPVAGDESVDLGQTLAHAHERGLAGRDVEPRGLRWGGVVARDGEGVSRGSW